jgi:hypothetical protein
VCCGFLCFKRLARDLPRLVWVICGRLGLLVSSDVGVGDRTAHDIRVSDLLAGWSVPAAAVFNPESTLVQQDGQVE